MATKNRVAPVTIENARIIFRNFTGRKGPYNEEGDRSFVVVLPEELGQRMMEAGWSVKEKPAYNPDPGEPEFEYHLKVKVEYEKGRPPRCVLVSSKGRNDLGAAEVSIFDYADIANVDLSLSPYSWTRPDGTSGTTAYLKTIFVTINEDPLELKYAEIPDGRPYDEDEVEDLV